MGDGQSLTGQTEQDDSDLRLRRTGGEVWYEERMWKRWQEIRCSPDYVALSNKLEYDDDGFPVDFEGLLNDPEAKGIMQKYGLLWIPSHEDDKLSKDDMIELFGTCVELLYPPSSFRAVPKEFKADFFKSGDSFNQKNQQDKDIDCFCELNPVWNGDFSVSVTNKNNQDNILDEIKLQNHLLFIINIGPDIPEAQIAAEVIDFVRHWRQANGICSENRGKSKTVRKLPPEIVLKMQQHHSQGMTLADITRKYWDILASEEDKKQSLDFWGSHINGSSAYNKVKRYLS